jgi:O-antigen biosynthesis protein
MIRGTETVGEPMAELGGNRPAVLMIEPGLGGGVDKHVRDLVALMRWRADFFLLAPNLGGLLRLSRLVPETGPVFYFRSPQELDGLVNFLRAAAIGRIHYHHTLWLAGEILKLPEILGVPYDYTVHDYYSFCPQIFLTTESALYCGEPNELGCNKCLEMRPAPANVSIEHWRSRHRAFVEGADRVFAPSPSVEQRVRRHFPNASIISAPHPEPIGAKVPLHPVWRHQAGPLRIVVLGDLSAIKGADLLEACAIDAARRDLALEFHLVGEPRRHLSHAGDRLVVHGKYHDDDVPRLLENLSPHIAWFPARWPETYSYTLSAVLREELPVAATNLGAIHDRLAGRALSWALPWESNSQEWNDFFMKLRSDPLLCEGQLVPAAIGQAKQFSYPKDYLLEQSSRIKNRDIKTGFGAYRSPLRASPDVLAQYIKGYARLCVSTISRFHGIRRIVVSVFPEQGLQLLRRWLHKL